jgi:hypothetical protein
LETASNDGTNTFLFRLPDAAVGVGLASMFLFFHESAAANHDRA